MPSKVGNLSQLEVLLLVMVKAAIATPYDLLSRVGIGVGTSSPALKRLKKNGLLSCTPGPRNRMRFALTAEGTSELKEAFDTNLAQYWKHGERDTFDSLRRIILLSWIDSRLIAAKDCVNRAKLELEDLVERRTQRAMALRRAALRLHEGVLTGQQPRDDGQLISLVSGWVDAVFDVSQYQLQNEALAQIMTLISELPHAPDLWSEHATATEPTAETSGNPERQQ
jgi:DNA-binding PadR family transcriptional regulator